MLFISLVIFVFDQSGVLNFCNDFVVLVEVLVLENDDIGIILVVVLFFKDV